MSRFYRKFGHITIAGDLIGSRMPGPTSSVIMAYWPGRGNTLTNIDYARMKVGVVQYFKSHLLVYHNGGVLHKDEHVFAYIIWILTMTVCANTFVSVSSSCLPPVQRIGCRCAYTIMPVDFGVLSESVFSLLALYL